MKNAEKNFTFWRSLFDLPDSFPELISLDAKTLKGLMVINQNVKDEIMSSLTSNKFTFVTVQKGYGLSTLFEYMYTIAEEESFTRITIPIKFDLSEYSSGSAHRISVQLIEEQIKLHILNSLLSENWEVQLRNTYYFDCINYRDNEDIKIYRTKMQRMFFDHKEHSFAEIAENFPYLHKPFDSFINYLLNNFRMQIIIYYHVPESMKEETLLDFVSSLKCLYDRSDIEYAALREIYFCTPMTKVDLNREYKRAFNVIHYPIYNSAQVFTMLQSRYTPTIPGKSGRQKQGLNSILDEKIIKTAWENSYSLKEITDKVRELILQRLNCQQQDIPYKLDLPAERTTEINDKQTEKPKIKRRFQRKSRNISQNNDSK